MKEGAPCITSYQPTVSDCSFLLYMEISVVAFGSLALQILNLYSNRAQPKPYFFYSLHLFFLSISIFSISIKYFPILYKRFEVGFLN